MNGWFGFVLSVPTPILRRVKRQFLSAPGAAAITKKLVDFGFL